MTVQHTQLDSAKDVGVDNKISPCTSGNAPSTYISNRGRICLVDARIIVKLDRQLKQRIVQLARLKGHDDPAEYVLAVLRQQLKLYDIDELNDYRDGVSRVVPVALSDESFCLDAASRVPHDI